MCRGEWYRKVCAHPDDSLTFSNVNCYHKTQGYQHSLPLPWFHPVVRGGGNTDLCTHYSTMCTVVGKKHWSVCALLLLILPWYALQWGRNTDLYTHYSYWSTMCTVVREGNADLYTKHNILSHTLLHLSLANNSTTSYREKLSGLQPYMILCSLSQCSPPAKQVVLFGRDYLLHVHMFTRPKLKCNKQELQRP